MRSLVFGLLCVMVFIVPWENLIYFESVGTLIRLIGYFTAGLAVITAAGTGSFRPLPRAFFLILLFWFWMFFSYSWTFDVEITRRQITTFLSLIIFLWLIWEFAPARNHQTWLLRMYIFGCMVSLVILYVNFMVARSLSWMATSRYTAAGLNANHLSSIIVFSIPMAIYLASQAKGLTGKIPLLYWAYIPVAGLGVILTGSRAGALALIVVLALLCFTFIGMKWKTKIMLIGSLACLAVLIASLAPSFLLERVDKMRETEISAISPDRVEIWSKGWEVFLDHQLIGVGAGAYSPVTSKDPSNYSAPAHNLVMSLLVELGIIGFMLFISFLVALAYNVLRLPGPERSLWLSILATWGLIAMTAPLESIKPTWFIFAMILSQSAALCVRKPRSAPVPMRMTFAASRSLKPK